MTELAPTFLWKKLSDDIPASELPTSGVVESKRVAAHSLPVFCFHRELNAVSDGSFVGEANVLIQIDGRNVRVSPLIEKLESLSCGRDFFRTAVRFFF